MEWENSLRDYRIWLKKLEIEKGSKPAAYKSVSGMFDEENKDAVPDGLMYYPAIYNFHVALIGFAVIAALAQLRSGADHWTMLFSLCTLCVGAWSIMYFLRWKPGALSQSVERNRVIWEAVLSVQRHPVPDNGLIRQSSSGS